MGFTTLAVKHRSSLSHGTNSELYRLMFSKRNAPKARCLEMLRLQLTRKRDHLISGSAFYLSGNTEHHLGRELANPHIMVRHTEETDTSDWGCSVLKYLTACASEYGWH